MAIDVNVWVIERSDRGVFVLRWNHPQTGRKCQKTITVKKRSDAYIAAGELRVKLAECGGDLRVSSKSHPSWDEFNKRYRSSQLSSTSKSNQGKWNSVVNAVDAEFSDRGIAVPMLRDITAEFLDAVQQQLVKRGNKSATIKSSMDTLMVGLNWAASLKLMDPVVSPRVAGRTEQTESEMHGRPLATEEFERILSQVKKHKRIANWADRWQSLLKGLWFSGLRLGEALDLHVDKPGCHRPVNLNTKRPAIAFVAGSQKNRKDQLVAIAPEFAEFLRSIDPIDGFYFNPWGHKGRYTTTGAVGRIIGELGEMAQVAVGNSEKLGNDGQTTAVTLYATAHDCRRSFARRWASRVMPPFLQHLMRHRSIETTQKYYVGMDADSAASTIYDAWLSSGGLVPEQILCDQVCDQLHSVSS